MLSPRTSRTRPQVERLEDREVPALTFPFPSIPGFPVNPPAVPALSSNPGAAAKLYLDFNGHRQARWGGTFFGPLRFGDETNIVTPPLDFDGNRMTFNSAGLSVIRNVWERVSEDFAPFNLDVTTMGDPGGASRGLWWLGRNEKGSNQDDMKVNARSENGFGYRADDHGGSIGLATPLAAQGPVIAGTTRVAFPYTPGSSVRASGIIGHTGDADYFAFWSGGGSATFREDVAPGGAANLDARIELRDARGNLIGLPEDPDFTPRGHDHPHAPTGRLLRGGRRHLTSRSAVE